jgi:hypothetical protein
MFRLGKGGMGEVWAAQRAAAQFGFERLVALKLLRGVTQESNAAEMFFDEARAAAALTHAAIVPTTDLGQYGDTFYIAMGMVRGPSLTAVLQRLAVQKQPIPPAIVAYIGERIASALDYAYDRAELKGQKLRLIHRDISPHNVLIDEEGNVLLSDFGVARTATQEHESRVGTVRGKPSYMAPEQVRGAAMDARTDIFALGIVMYEAACVKRLFGRSNPVKSMDAVVSYEPKPLDTLVPDFPAALWQVISRALAKDPEHRFANAGEMARALGEVSRTLPGSRTAARDLAALIAEVFPAGSFDVDARVQEALKQGSAAEAGPEPQEATKYEPTPRRSMSAVAFAEPVGTGAWPTAYAGAEPLDPEALEALAEAQAQMAAGRAPGMFSATNSGSMPSFQGASYPQVTGTGVAGTRRGPTLAIVAVAVAAVAAAVTALLVLNTRSVELAANELVPVPIPTVLPGELQVGATPAPGALSVPGATRVPAATQAPASTAPLASSAPSIEPRRSVAPSPRPTRAPVATAEPTGESPAAAAARAPVTRESVVALIRQVPDTQRAKELMAALIEAGSDDTMLLRVRDQALAAQKP